MALQKPPFAVGQQVETDFEVCGGPAFDYVLYRGTLAAPAERKMRNISFLDGSGGDQKKEGWVAEVSLNPGQEAAMPWKHIVAVTTRNIESIRALTPEQQKGGRNGSGRKTRYPHNARL